MKKNRLNNATTKVIKGKKLIKIYDIYLKCLKLKKSVYRNYGGD